MDYRLVETKKGFKAAEEFTSARRYSFLVGKNEDSHTAKSRLVPLLMEDEHHHFLNEVEEVFNVEKVTKEFFEKYRDLFIRTKEALDAIIEKDEKVRNDFSQKGITAVDFAKKLLGQIVFLYFLQKKGWFGVTRDAVWGTGPKNFLRRLFRKEIAGYDNFFNDILEPLFYNTLALERPYDYSDRFNCKIPFLNGGLFDPINNYSWVYTDILLPNDLFSNDVKTKEGDTGTGILDVFDRYNFTVKEDEPLEKEVAVDPEMLGKVFENLLEVKDRKSKGTYYTPREIVHYMCQESLINYLVTEVGAYGNTPLHSECHSRSPLSGNPVPSREDIEKLIKYGETAVEHDRRVVTKGRETKDYSFKLPESIRDYAALIDEKLKNIRVFDPAIGSGAFPVGMMHEIVKVRNALTTYLSTPGISSPPLKKGGEGGFSDERTPYNFKRLAIHDCLYGVDIDPGAVEIAKLRLWLSLMVDEEDIKHIKPLPNLDYKIVCGNSLLSVNILFHHNQIKTLEGLKAKYFEETNARKKIQLKEDIDALIKEITHDDRHFDFRIYFSEVFEKNKGFDVVIANPPYVRQEAIKDIKPFLAKEFGNFYCGTADIYTYFYKRGIDVLKPGGHLCFIAPNKFMRAGYGKNTRELLTRDVTPVTVIDFCDLPIFDATTYPAVVVVEKNHVGARSSRPPLETAQRQGGKTPPLQFLAATFTNAEQLLSVDDTLSSIGFPMSVSALKPEGWNLEQPEVLALMEKLRKAGTPLGEYVQGRFYYGIKTGFNEAFVIDAETRKRLISEDPKSKELIKPWLRGRDVKKWKAEWANLYLINIQSSSNHQWLWSDEKTESRARKIFKETYPAIHDHLIQWKDKLQKRDDQGKFWWELRSCAYNDDFRRPKIIYPDIAKASEFTWDESNAFLGNTAYIIPTDEIWLVGLLNSQLIWWLYLHISSTIQGGFVRFIAQYMEQLPIPSVTDSQKAPIIEHVNKILADPDSPDVPRLEKEIDRLVYKLYDLTPEEIAIVEGEG